MKFRTHAEVQHVNVVNLVGGHDVKHFRLDRLCGFVYFLKIVLLSIVSGVMRGS